MRKCLNFYMTMNATASIIIITLIERYAISVKMRYIFPNYLINAEMPNFYTIVNATATIIIIIDNVM